MCPCAIERQACPSIVLFFLVEVSCTLRLQHFSPSLHPLYNVSGMGACFPCNWGSWLGCQDLTAIGALLHHEAGCTKSAKPFPTTISWISPSKYFSIIDYIFCFQSNSSIAHTSYFIKAIDHTFYGFTGAINPLGTRKACKSLQAFLVFSQHHLLHW